jgi:hypothetical protein
MEFEEKMSLGKMSKYLGVQRSYLKAIANAKKMKIYKIKNTKKYDLFEMKKYIKKDKNKIISIYESVCYIKETYHIYESKMNYINDL